MAPHILCFGLPGSGKSSTSKKLASDLKNYIWHNLRDIREKFGMHLFDSSKDTAEQEQMLNDYFANLISSLKNKSNLIFDRAGCKKENRENSYRIASSFGKEILAIWHDIPNELAYERIEARNPEYSGTKTAIKHNSPELRKEYEKRWNNPRLDLENPINSHVSMIRFDANKQVIERIRVNSSIIDFVNDIEKLLLE